jgi:hypothetical protein
MKRAAGASAKRGRGGAKAGVKKGRRAAEDDPTGDMFFLEDDEAQKRSAVAEESDGEPDETADQLRLRLGAQRDWYSARGPCTAGSRMLAFQVPAAALGSVPRLPDVPPAA